MTEMHDDAPDLGLDLRSTFGGLRHRYANATPPPAASMLAPFMPVGLTIDSESSATTAHWRTRFHTRRKKIMSTIAAFVGTTVGKVVLGTTVAVASVGGGQAAGVIDVPGLGGDDADPIAVVEPESSADDLCVDTTVDADQSDEAAATADDEACTSDEDEADDSDEASDKDESNDAADDADEVEAVEVESDDDVKPTPPVTAAPQPKAERDDHEGDESDHGDDSDRGDDHESDDDSDRGDDHESDRKERSGDRQSAEKNTGADSDDTD